MNDDLVAMTSPKEEAGKPCIESMCPFIDLFDSLLFSMLMWIPYEAQASQNMSFCFIPSFLLCSMCFSCSIDVF